MRFLIIRHYLIDNLAEQCLLLFLAHTRILLFRPLARICNGSNQIYADSHNRLSCLERLLRQFIDHCSVLPILFSLCFLSYVGDLTHGIPFLLYICCPPFYLNFWTTCPKATFLFFIHKCTKKSIHAFYT